jgi:Flp pilus assembly protein TadD
LYVLERFQEAVESLRRAITLEPTLADAHSNLGVVFTRIGRKKEAHKCYLEAVKLRPDWEVAQYNLAMSFHTRNKRDEALKHLNILKKLDVNLAEQLRKQLNEAYILDASKMEN